jgi:hypothetical protein
MKGGAPSALIYISRLQNLDRSCCRCIFLSIFNRTVLQMKDYHDRLLEEQNVLLAQITPLNWRAIGMPGAARSGRSSATPRRYSDPAAPKQVEKKQTRRTARHGKKVGR